MKRPRITLCMIVCDEAESLGFCLASARKAVDAMVVVDTGSHDETRSIAQSYGARVIDVPWQSDFAAARNAGLAEVRDGFVLVLDADERLAGGSARGIRDAVESMEAGAIDLALLPLHHADGLTASPEDIVSGSRRLGEIVWLPRLMRWDEDLRYEGCVHETVGAWALGREATLATCPIVHYGACPEARLARGKDARNRRLLERRVKMNPSDALGRGYLSREYQRSGDLEAAYAQALEAWKLIEHAQTQGGSDGEITLPVGLHAQFLIDRGELEEAKRVLLAAMSWSDEPPHPNLIFLSGVVAESEALGSDEPGARLAEAAKRYEEYLRHSNDALLGERIDGVSGWQSRERLGTVRLQQRQFEAALAEFSHALDERPESRASLLGRIEAIWGLDQRDRARALIRELEFDDADSLALRAQLAGSAGDPGSEAHFHLLARKAADRDGFVAPHRRSWLEPGCRESAASTDTGPELSVIVASYQRCDKLMACLDALESQSVDPARFEIIVVNDESTDGTREQLAARTPRVSTQIVERKNGGLAAARNTGLAVARGEIVLLINDDTMADRHLVETHLEIHARNLGQETAVLGSFEQPAEALRSPLMRVLESNHMVFCFSGMEAGARYDWTRFWTCNVSVRASAIASVGGFDENFRHYGGEDTELALRLADAGMEVVYEPRARAVHSHTLGADELRSRTRNVARAWVRLFVKHPSALLHPDWRWVETLTRETCRQFIEPRALHAGLWELAVKELSGVDLREVGRARGSDRVARVLESLEAPLQELHRLWWHEGLLQGLEEHGLDNFSALRSSVAEGDFETRSFLAWPRYESADELDRLLAEFGKILADQKGVQLCLLHDPSSDAPVDAAMQWLEEAYARQLPDGQQLDVLFFSEVLTLDVIADLHRKNEAVLAIPGQESATRAGFVTAIARPQIDNGDDLLRALLMR